MTRDETGGNLPRRPGHLNLPFDRRHENENLAKNENTQTYDMMTMPCGSCIIIDATTS